MAYVAVKGGQQAIEESIKNLKQERLQAGTSIDVKDIKNSMRLLIDQIMSESSIYSRELASLAIKQGEGSMEEAVFLLRAYRSTLPRKYYSTVVESKSMEVERRISAAFKDIPEGQILGSSYDYVHRLLDFDLIKESNRIAKRYQKRFLEEQQNMVDDNRDSLIMPKVSDYLRSEGLLKTIANNNDEPKDATKEILTFPTKRSERLQILSRGMTQALISLGYASLRGYGVVHPTVGELRVGELPICVANPLNKEDEEDQYYIGEIKVTEVESLIPNTITNDQGEKEIEFKVGYGITLGQNESKAIAMSILDNCLESEDKRFAINDEEFVLYHVDAIEATGFISHLKLPHYVTFQSKLNSVRNTKRKK